MAATAWIKYLGERHAKLSLTAALGLKSARRPWLNAWLGPAPG
jgi:hypothetical protein